MIVNSPYYHDVILQRWAKKYKISIGNIGYEGYCFRIGYNKKTASPAFFVSFVGPTDKFYGPRKIFPFSYTDRKDRKIAFSLAKQYYNFIQFGYNYPLTTTFNWEIVRRKNAEYLRNKKDV